MKPITTTASLALFLAACAPHEPTPAESIAYHAQKLCRLIDGSEVMSKRCEVSIEDSTVRAYAHISKDDALIACGSISKIAKQRGLTFASGWRFNIYTLASGTEPIATCALLS